MEAHERRLVTLMGALVATLFCAYTVAKVERDAIFLAEFGALALPYAYIGVALASAGFVWMEARIVRRYARFGATRFNQYLAIAFSLLAALAFPVARHQTAAAFYLWTGSQAMILLPHFWVLALDVWDSRRARRLFPLFSACGLTGGLVGGAIAGWLTPVLKRVGLMWTLAGLLIVAHAMTRAVDRHRLRRPGPADVTTAPSRWEIVRRSRYIKFLAVALALSVIVGTLVDFQFKFLIQHVYPDPHALTQFLGKFYAVMNGLALLFQVGIAGWLLRRLDLVATTALQPGSMMLLGWWVAATHGWWPIIAMRGVQGVVLQVLGKSSAEIYYMAVRPPERRSIKPAIDTLVERWSDALVGVLLIAVLHTAGVGIPAIAGITAAIAAVWLAVLVGLNRQYRQAIRQALSSRWIEPEAAAESMRIPSARAALLSALRSGEERRTILALKLCEYAAHPEIARAVRDALANPSSAVRVAAVEAAEALRLRDCVGIIEPLLAGSHEGLRRAAVGYLLTMSREPTSFVLRLIDGDDPALRQYMLDALFDRPHEAPGAITPEWIKARLASGRREDLLLAARALGAITGSAPESDLRALLSHPDLEIRRTALLSAARRPSPKLLDAVLAQLFTPELSYEARLALAAIGDPAVAPLRRLLTGAEGVRVQALAARALTQMATPHAVDALMTLVRSGDRIMRHLGIRSVSRVRVRTGEPALPRATVHRLFLRDLRDYREWLEPALRLAADPEPEVRLLAQSFREFAEMALERAIRALACWYEPKPLFGTFERLRSQQRGAGAPALEYLGHVLPRAVFRPVLRVFEEDPAEAGGSAPPSRGELAGWVRVAWQSGDPWLRACAVRASRFTPEIDPRTFETEDGENPVVRAEVAARFAPAAPTAIAARASRSAG